MDIDNSRAAGRPRLDNMRPLEGFDVNSESPIGLA
jgi:hypothetical protein